MALAQQSANVANCLFIGTVENSSINVGVMSLLEILQRQTKSKANLGWKSVCVAGAESRNEPNTWREHQKRALHVRTAQALRSPKCGSVKGWRGRTCRQQVACPGQHNRHEAPMALVRFSPFKRGADTAGVLKLILQML